MKFSIIIPAFNAEKYIFKCLNSVINQSFIDYEIIIINDGSVDKTLEICEEFMKNRLDIIRLINQDNKGASFARNVGIVNSRGDYLLFLDSDDFWRSPDLLLNIDKRIRENYYDLIYFQVSKYYELDNKIIENIGNLDRNAYYENDCKSFLKYLVQKNEFIASSCNKCVKRNLVLENNIFFEEGLTAEDVDWVIKIFHFVQSVTHIDGNYYAYRQNVQGSVTNSSRLQAAKSIEVIISKWLLNFELEHCTLDYELKSFLAYHFVILMGLIGENNYEIMRIKKSNMYQLLHFDLHPRVKLVRYSTKIIGFKLSCKLLNLYLNKK